MITGEDLSYIAGVIDSDGYIGLTRSQERRRGDHYSMQIKPVVTITQTQQEAINFIKSFFAGHSHVVNFPKSKNWKTQYMWGLYARQSVMEFLGSILPYLKIKKRQAELVIQYCIMRERILSDISRLDIRGRPRRSSKYTYSGKEYEMWNEIKQLNQTGVKICQFV